MKVNDTEKYKLGTQLQKRVQQAKREGESLELVVSSGNAEYRIKPNPDAATKVLYSFLEKCGGATADVQLFNSEGEAVFFETIAAQEDDTIAPIATEIPSFSGVGGDAASFGAVLARLEGNQHLMAAQNAHNLEKLRLTHEIERLQSEISRKEDETIAAKSEIADLKKERDTLKEKVDAANAFDKTVDMARGLAPLGLLFTDDKKKADAIMAFAGGTSVSDSQKQLADGGDAADSSPRAPKLAEISTWAKSLPEDVFTDFVFIVECLAEAADTIAPIANNYRTALAKNAQQQQQQPQTEHHDDQDDDE